MWNDWNSGWLRHCCRKGHKMRQQWWVLCQKQVRPGQQGSFLLLQHNPQSSHLCDFCRWLAHQGGGAMAKGLVTRDSLTGSPHRPAASVSEDLQQKIYCSCLYPPVGIRDRHLWMWAITSSFTCQKWLREFISELCLPHSLTILHFLLRYIQILFGLNLPISLMPITEVALCWFMWASNTSMWWLAPCFSSQQSM